MQLQLECIWNVFFPPSRINVICHSFLKLDILNVPFYSDNPALVFKTLADITKRDTSPNSDEEGELQETHVTNMQLISLE